MIFEDCWRSVLLQAPDLPAMTARKFVADTYLWVAARRGWGFLRKQAAISVLASRAVTVGVTLASATITSAAAFVATDVGRQFRIGTGETFTVLTFTNASALILDRVYTGATTAAASATILDAYATMPADFARFDTLVDSVQQRRIAWWISQEQLNGLDPQRSNSGSPTLLSPMTPAPVTGYARYEWQPRPSNAAVYPYLYFARPSAPADTDSFVGVLAERTDVLELGALARAARYPGTADRPNAYFNLALARDLSEQFEALALQLNLRDDDLSMQDYVPDEFWARAASWDYGGNLHRLRATDAGVSDYAFSF